MSQKRKGKSRVSLSKTEGCAADGETRIHPTAEVSPKARIGAGTSIWHQVQVREGVTIGRNCILSKGVYIDSGVILGDNVKVQNYVSIYHGVTLEDGVFCGPHCVFTNDKRPRAINADGSLKTGEDWTLSETLVRTGASIGANAVIVCGITIGAWAMVGAGSVVTGAVPDHGLVWGNPARLRGFVCYCGNRLADREMTLEAPTDGRAEARPVSEGSERARLTCRACGCTIRILRADWERVE
jgi:acetyltransferase-like isoleucine patch superfamily enzyme